jgi:UDP-N-acetylmuramoylalanine--D-glutamate ligase
LFAEIVRDFNNSILEKSLEKNILQNPETIKIIGITGTRAKTTTTFLIKAILDEFVEGLTPNSSPGEREKSSVYFGGNVQGVATLENLKQLKAGDYVVMELDSWVLQGFADIKFSPQVAVFTTFMPDHMNYYKGDTAEYFNDKANIFLYQKEGNVLVTTETVESEIQKYLPDMKVDSERILVSEVEMEEDKSIFKSELLGRHNQIPVSLAVRVGRVLGVNEETIKKVVGEFRGVKGRLELIKESAGIRVYNDTTATTGDAAVAAMRAVEELLVSDGGLGKMTLITGGRDKELDMTGYLDTMEDLYNKGIIKKIIFLQDETTTGTNRVLKEKAEAGAKYSFTYSIANSLEQAVEQAKSLATQGDVVILSPGFASFGMFQNEYDRGGKFVATINEHF